MNAGASVGRKMDTRILISTLWLIVILNMMWADILSLNIPGAAEAVAKTAGDTPIPLLMLAGAIGVEISTVMIILSRVLQHRLNRILNLVASVFTLVFIWGASSAYPHYTFLASVETICLLLILWKAWKWSSSEA
ncbi:MAG TPA: DUF6326 family protein [Anaerolineales bacterium]|nr:DUF6326 family protein [Anaerolineales bacterium]